MPIEHIVKKYITDLSAEYANSVQFGQHTAEMSFRPIVDSFFSNICLDINADIVKILEPKNQSKAGRPDWRFHNRNNLGIYGYVEAKGVDSKSIINIDSHKEQIEKYKKLGHRLILTDGIDFIFIYPNKANPVTISLIEKPFDSSKWIISQKANLIKSQFDLFFETPTARQCSDEELISEVAVRAKYLSDLISEICSVPIQQAFNEQEKFAIMLLSELKQLVQNHHDPRLRTDRVFSDFIAQVVMFGLLYAHRVHCENTDLPKDKMEKISSFWKDNLIEKDELRAFKDLFVVLNKNIDRSLSIAARYEECLLFLSYVKISDENIKKPDYHSLFERFLKSFDPQSIFDYGAYYTPKVLANFTVRLLNHVVDENLGTSIYNDNNKIVDPCCGTGSFIEEIIVHDKINGNYHISGFEILPAPYALANYRMKMLQKQIGIKNYKYDIVLTNTLSDAIENDSIEPKDSNINVLENEQQIAREHAKPPITVIIGNPPSSDSFKNNEGEMFSIINQLMEDYRLPVELRRARQNTQKQISNPFLQFLRWSCNKIEVSNQDGAIALILPSSFLEGESYRYARKALFGNYGDIWAVHIDLDARTGVRSDSLFNTLQGRILLIATRTKDSLGTNICRYLDISKFGRDEKNTFLKQDILSILPGFVDILVDNSYKMLPQKPFNQKQYDKFWPVSSETDDGIFNNYCAGIKLAPTSMFVHVNQNMLIRRTNDIIRGIPGIIDRWYNGQSKKPADIKLNKLGPIVNSLKITSVTDDVYSYTFRPFLFAKVWLRKDVLKEFAKIGGGGTRPRPEIIKAFSNPGTYGIAISHSPKDQSGRLLPFVSFCWSFPDNDLCSRGNSYIYNNQFVVGRNSDELSKNLNEGLLNLLHDKYEIDISEIEDKLLFYIYAILSSDRYLDEFEGALFTVNSPDTRARVPIISSKDLFLAIAGLGTQLANVEKEVLEGTLLSECEEYLSKNESIIMPSDFKLMSYSFDEENELIILKSNEINLTLKCQLQILRFEVSGYTVLKQWLKFYSYVYTRCLFTEENLNDLKSTIFKITKHIEIVQSTDSLIKQIIDGDCELIEVESSK